MENINNNELRCNECGCVLTEDDAQYTTSEGEVVCESCADNDFFYCEDCNELVRNDDVVTVYTDGYMNNYTYACERCAERNYYRDYDNGEYFESNDCGCYTHDGCFISRLTYENSYNYCSDCDEVYPTDELIWNEHDDCYYCECCAEEHSEIIYNYHQFNDWQEFKLENEAPEYLIGFELEIDNDDYSFNYDAREVHDLITSNINSVLMHDGSLSSNGIEIVSHPQSFGYLMAQYNKYDATFKQLQEIGFTSHDNGRCGLHFHITRPSDEVTDRINLLVENFKQEITTFSRRTSSQLSEWAQFMSDYTGNNNNNIKSLYYIKKHKDRINGSRYHALNTTNSRTVEFRFCRGTLNTETFFASVELVNNIVKIASDLTLNINDVDWLDLIKGDHCYNYCQSKSLTVSHKAEDNTDKILQTIATFNIKRDEFINNIQKYNKYLVNDFNKKYGVKTFKIKALDDINNLQSYMYAYQSQASDLITVEHILNRLDIEDSEEVHHLAWRLNDIANASRSNYYKRIFEKMREEAKLLCV